MVALLLVAGLALLVAGGDLLVRGSSGIAGAMGVPPLIVGLTVVACGTSAPELAVSVQGALSGAGDIAVGNVVGSNIFNVLFILGISALILPLAVSRQLVRLDVPLMIGVSVLVLAMALDGSISLVEGSILVAGLVAWLGMLGWIGRRDARASAVDGAARGGRRSWIDGVLIVAGLALLILGARWFVDGAVELARWLGVSEVIVGLTVIAAGTSLPEVVASIMASLRGERDIAVGNVVGSNLFNLLGVLGISGVVAPAGLAVGAGVIRFDLPVLVIVAVACLPVCFTGTRIARWEGALFIGLYGAYTTWLALTATDHPAQATFGTAMTYFVVPLTAVTLAVLALRACLGGERA